MTSINQFLALHTSAISLRTARAEVLASNLANADTPGYRAKDIDFSTALQQAGNAGTARLSATNSRHLTGQSSSHEGLTHFRDSPDGSLDENTVDSDFERTQFADNAIRYQSSVQFINSKINGLIRALRSE